MAHAVEIERKLRGRQVMTNLRFVGIILLLSLPPLAPAQQRWQSCLPPGIKAIDVVSAELAVSSKGSRTVKTVTVRQKLNQLRAHCRHGKLVDSRGKEIHFYHLTGCWGNPPADYLKIIQRQEDELKELKKKYTVIEMTCNPSGIPIP
jgi:hypothetical protein